MKANFQKKDAIGATHDKKINILFNEIHIENLSKNYRHLIVHLARLNSYLIELMVH